MELPSGDAAFFPVYFETEDGREIELPKITLLKDHRLRRMTQRAIQRGPGLSMLLHGPTPMKQLSLALNSCGEDLAEIAGFILETSPEEALDTLSIAEMVELVISVLYTPTGEDDTERVEQGEIWTFSRVLDFLAKEYGWTIQDTLECSRWELKAVMQAASERQKEVERMMEEARQGSGRSRRTPTLGSRSKDSNKAWREVPKPSKPKVNPDGTPDWSRSEGIGSLFAFSKATGTPIKGK